MKKNLTLYALLLFFLTVSISSAQNITFQDAERGSETLTDLMDKIKNLDLMISENIYGNNSDAVITKYDARLTEAQKILDSLEALDNRVFKKCMETDPNEQSYPLYSALTKLTELGIISQKSSYINYLKTNSQTVKKYDELKAKWEDKEKELVKSARGLITNKVLFLDKNNYYAKILLDVCYFYEKKQDKAINELKSINTQLKEDIIKNKNKPDEVADKERLLSFSLTWLGYIYKDKKKIDTAYMAFDEAMSMDEQDNRSAEWIKNVNSQLKDAKAKTKDTIIPEFELPKSSGSFNMKKLTFQKDNPVNPKSPIYEFNLEDEPKQFINDQKDLIILTMGAWDKLEEIENNPWQKYVERMKSCRGKFSKDDYESMFCKMNKDNDGGGDNNLRFYKERFTEAYEVLNKLHFLRQCWTNFINSNPDIAFFRLYRIKVDLGIYYMSHNASSFTDFLSYYKIQKKTISPDYMSKINDDFALDQLSEIKDDYKAVSKDNGDNIVCLLTKAEIAAYTEGDANNALNIINDVESKIPLKTTMGDVDPASIIELDRSYASLRLKNSDKLKQSTLALNSFPELDYWRKYLKDYYLYYFENDKSITK